MSRPVVGKNITNDDTLNTSIAQDTSKTAQLEHLSFNNPSVADFANCAVHNLNLPAPVVTHIPVANVDGPGALQSNITLGAAQVSAGSLASNVDLTGRINNSLTTNIVGAVGVQGSNAVVDVKTLNNSVQPLVQVGRVTGAEGLLTVATTAGQYNFASGTGQPLGTLAGDTALVAANQLLLTCNAGSSSTSGAMMFATNGTIQLHTPNPLYGCQAPKLAANFMSYSNQQTTAIDFDITLSAAQVVSGEIWITGLTAQRTWFTPTAAQLDVPAAQLGCPVRNNDCFQTQFVNQSSYGIVLVGQSDVLMVNSQPYPGVSNATFIPPSSTTTFQFRRDNSTPTWNVSVINRISFASRWLAIPQVSWSIWDEDTGAINGQTILLSTKALGFSLSDNRVFMSFQDFLCSATSSTAHNYMRTTTTAGVPYAVVPVGLRPVQPLSFVIPGLIMNNVSVNTLGRMVVMPNGQIILYLTSAPSGIVSPTNDEDCMVPVTGGGVYGPCFSKVLMDGVLSTTGQMQISWDLDMSNTALGYDANL